MWNLAPSLELEFGQNRLSDTVAKETETATSASESSTKQRILRVSADLFMENGYAATSVRQVAELAQVSQSALYYHVSSKAHLLRMLHEEFINDMLDRLLDVVAHDLSPTEKLRQIIHVTLSIIDKHQAEVTVFLREQHSLPLDMRANVIAQRDRVDDLVDGVLRAGIKSGDFRSDLDIRIVRLGILGMCNWAYQWYRPGHGLTIDEISDQFCELVLTALTASEVTGRSASRTSRAR